MSHVGVTAGERRIGVCRSEWWVRLEWLEARSYMDILSLDVQECMICAE